MSAGIKSAYLRSEVIKAALGEDTFPTITGAYLALFTTDPLVDGSGTEVVGGSYAREQISWAAEADGNISNDTLITFTDLPASVITHWGIYDAVSAGNLLYFGSFEVSLNINALDDLDIAIGNIQISEK